MNFIISLGEIRKLTTAYHTLTIVICLPRAWSDLLAQRCQRWRCTSVARERHFTHAYTLHYFLHFLKNFTKNIKYLKIKMKWKIQIFELLTRNLKKFIDLAHYMCIVHNFLKEYHFRIKIQYSFWSMSSILRLKQCGLYS